MAQYSGLSAGRWESSRWNSLESSNQSCVPSETWGRYCYKAREKSKFCQAWQNVTSIDRQFSWVIVLLFTIDYASIVLHRYMRKRLFEILFSTLNAEGTVLDLGRNQNKKQSLFLSIIQREMHTFQLSIFNIFIDYFFSHACRQVLTQRVNTKMHLRNYNIS